MKICKGDIVRCRLYNTPEKRYYGEIFYATVEATDNDKTKNYLPARKYLVKGMTGHLMTLHRKEILNIVNTTPTYLVLDNE